MAEERGKTSTDAAQSLEVSFAAGEVIFREGDDSNRDLYILLEGTVEVCKSIFRLAELSGQNTFLGEMSTLIQQPRTATLVARTPCRLYRIPEEKMQGFFQGRPAMAIRLAAILAERLQQMNTKYFEVLQAASQDEEKDPRPPAVGTAVLDLGGLASLAAKDDDSLLLSGVQAPEITFVNQKPVKGATPIVDGDIIQVGKLVLSVAVDPSERMQLPSEREVEEQTAAAPSIPAAGPAPSDLAATQKVDEGTLAAQIEALQAQPFSDGIKKAVADRLACFQQIQALDEKRQALEGKKDLPEEGKSELSRQRRELNKLPAAEALKQARDKVKKRLIVADREADKAVPALMRQALDLGQEQRSLLLQRAAMDPDVIQAGAGCVSDEPLYRILSKLSIAPDKVFGWAVYALALQEVRRHRETKLQAVREELKGLEEKKSGFLTFGKDKQEASIQSLRQQEQEHLGVVTCVGRELKAIETEMVEAFWAVYESAAMALVNGVAAADEPYVRAFLRYGLLGCSPRFLETDRVKDILFPCAKPLGSMQHSMGGHYVFYADEYLEKTAEGFLAPSLNEDLELNHRHSPMWRADKAWRRIIHTRFQEAAYDEIAADLAQRLETERSEQAKAEEAMERVDKRSSAGKEKLRQLRQAVQQHKVKAGRLERLLDKVRNEMLRDVLDDRDGAEERLVSSGMEISKASLVRQEVAAIRRGCRLVAKLAEPFLPFVLRERFKPEQKAVNDRGSMIAALEDAETRDPLLLKEVLVPGQKRNHREFVRHPMVILLTPASGHLAFLWTPRSGPEIGRTIFPGYCPQGGIQERILWDVLADYRYDTSKSSAGVDLLNSDTLVAAYANVRWLFRKKGKEFRQKAGIYMEENERTNWRRHYALYMRSAPEAGKHLFFKCPDLYDAIINKYLDLPEGCEKLKRG